MAVEMKMKTIIAVLVLFCCVQFSFVSGHGARTKRHFFSHYRGDTIMDVSDFSIYYDLETNATIKKMLPRPWYQPGWRLRLPFQASNCNCEGLLCSCCSGIRVPAFNFDRQTCANLTFNPSEYLIDVDVSMDNSTIFHRSYSVMNPPPFCIPIPIPYIPINLMDLCIRLFDITVDFNKMHVCMDWDTRIDKAPVLILHFDCMDMGTGGVSLSKPGSNGGSQGNSTTPATAGEPPQLAADIYDLVTEDADISTQTNLFNNSVKYI